jgi:hypothetical protein
LATSVAAVVVFGGATAVSVIDGGAQATERIIGLGFEDVVDRADFLPSVAEQLDRVGATGVSVAVGRVDWTAFPWEEHPQSWSSAVTSTNRDYVAEAIRLVNPSDNRNIIAVIDVLVEKWIDSDPAIAGISATGERSTLFASLSALTDGPVGDRIVELVGTVAKRYSPDAISLTELFIDTYSFGPDDLESYRAWSGTTDWPRSSSGDIDTEHPTIGEWRAGAVTSLVERAAAASHDHGVELFAEVRASWNGPHADPGMHGQDYSALLRVADKLVVWGYFGLSDRDASYLETIARELPDSSRFVLSIGMWARKGTISGRELTEAIAASRRGGMSAVWITPTSLLTERHWDSIREAWLSG